MSRDTSTSLLTFGPYEVVSRIGKGGTGTVYRARHRDSGDVVAVKVLPPQMAANPTVLRRFEKEFRATRLLNHPNIVRALDYGSIGNTPYLVMEFVEGVSLGERVERYGRLPEAEAVCLITQIAQGLAEAHRQGLIHRDVKPDNILVTPDGQAKLIDLGLVKEADADISLTRTGRGLGTPHFMAPEQFRAAKNADERCDLYSLGATLYQLVTGELPFNSLGGPVEALTRKLRNELTAPRLLVPSLSEVVERAILRAMSPNRERRPATCQEFLDDLAGRTPPQLPETTPIDLWYLAYCDVDGRERTAAGALEQVRGWFAEGRMRGAREILASRTEMGPFVPLAELEELRDLAVSQSLAPPAAALTARKPEVPETGTTGTGELVAIFLITLFVALAAGQLLFR